MCLSFTLPMFSLWLLFIPFFKKYFFLCSYSSLPFPIYFPYFCDFLLLFFPFSPAIMLLSLLVIFFPSKVRSLSFFAIFLMGKIFLTDVSHFLENITAENHKTEDSVLLLARKISILGYVWEKYIRT